MVDERIRDIIRRFPENGIKLLLMNAANARDLLVLARAAVVGLIDFGRMKAPAPRSCSPTSAASRRTWC